MFCDLQRYLVLQTMAWHTALLPLQTGNLCRTVHVGLSLFWADIHSPPESDLRRLHAALQRSYRQLALSRDDVHPLEAAIDQLH